MTQKPNKKEPQNDAAAFKVGQSVNARWDPKFVEYFTESVDSRPAVYSTDDYKIEAAQSADDERMSELMASLKSKLSQARDHTTGDSLRKPDSDGYWVYVDMNEQQVPKAASLITLQGDIWWYTVDDEPDSQRIIDTLPSGGLYIFIY